MLINGVHRDLCPFPDRFTVIVSSEVGELADRELSSGAQNVPWNEETVEIARRMSVHGHGTEI